jgi:DnaJ-domain-containing protein 1
MHLRKFSRFALPMPGRAAAQIRYSIGGLAQAQAQQPNRPAPAEPDFRQLSFTFAVIALCAKVASQNAPLTGDKYLAFRAGFPLTGGLCGKLRKLFMLACANPTPHSHYLSQIKQLFPGRRALYVSLVDRLFAIACASGSLSREDDRMLAGISHALDISAADYSAARERHLSTPRPHEVLGLHKKTAYGQVKKRYRELMRSWHPDRFASETVSPEVDMLLRLKASEINEAYRLLSRKPA